MYIVNPETIPKDKKYACNNLVAKFLIYQKNIPLFAREGKTWYFARTEILREALKELPFWLKIMEKGGSYIDKT
jgi:hypothetical protein